MPVSYRSSPEVQREFRGGCGTSLAFRGDAHPEKIDISAGSLDDPGQVTPQDHIWAGSMVPWLGFDDALPRLQGSHWEHG